MSSAGLYGAQRVWTWTGRGWAPTRGVHRGINCDLCGQHSDDIYRREGLTVGSCCLPEKASLSKEETT